MEDICPIAISIPEAARRIGISRTTFWKIVKAGHGPPLLKVGGRTLVLVEALMSWLRCQQRD